MRTEVVTIEPRQPEEEIVRRTAEVLRRGGVIVFPTETVYGLGGDGSREGVVRRIYEIKGRPEGKPLVRLVAGWDELEGIDWDPAHRRLAERFWPGPLTLVLARQDGGRQGFRFPDHPLVRVLIRESGVKLVATSANRSGEPEVSSGVAASRIFSGEVDLVLDGGIVRGVPSTVLDLSVSPPRLLRPGPVSKKEIEMSLGYGIV